MLTKKKGIAVLSAFMFLSLMAPAMSAYCYGDIASADIAVRLFEFAIFGNLGVFVVLFPMFLPAVMLSHLKKHTKLIILLILTSLMAMGFCSGLSGAYVWLRNVSGSLISLSPYLALYVTLCSSAFLLSYLELK